MSGLHCHRHFDLALQIYDARNGHFPFIADYAYFCSLLRISSAFFFHSCCKYTAGTKPFPRTSVRFLFVFCIVYFPLQRYNFSYLRIGLRRVTTGFAGTNADKSAFVPYSSINCQIVKLLNPLSPSATTCWR